MGLKELWRDFWNIEKYVPKELKVYENEETGEVAVEIRNPPNPFVPEHIKVYENSKRGIIMVHINQKESEQQVENRMKEISNKTKLLRW